MHLREFTEKDASEVSSVIRNAIMYRDNRGYTLAQLYAIANHYSSETICSNLQDKKIFVCEENGRIVGTATLNKDELMACFILPEYQGKGIGKKFVKLRENEAKKNGIFRVWLVAALSSYNYYKKLEYSLVSEKNHPSWGKGFIMEKFLNEG